METVKLSKQAISKAFDVLNSGGVVIFPTDTVYGFLADAGNKKAVDKIFKIKKRLKSKPLSVFVNDIKSAKEIAKISKEQEKIINKKWPGKYTFVFERNSGIKLYGVDKKTIGIRIPKYDYLNLLLKKIKRPLAQTSVNVSGEKELNKVNDIISKFELGKNQPDLIVCPVSFKKSKPSKVIDFTKEKPEIIRN